MPERAHLADQLARTLVDLYAELETRLATDLARRFAAGMDRPDWADEKLAAIGTVRRWAQTLLDRLDGPLADRVAQAVILAWMRGGRDALAELARVQDTHPDWLARAGLADLPPGLQEMVNARRAGLAAELARVATHMPGAAAINRLVLSLVSTLRGTHLRILRWTLDAYRDVIARAAAPDVLAGLASRRRAAQVAWEQLLSRGITGFVDRAGRRWQLASYVEMATRSTVAQALVEGHLDRLGAAGLDLVMVSNSPQECARCRPWEGTVLSRSGPAGRRTEHVASATAEDTVAVEVAGSVNEAVRGGLLHPNCTHRLTAYLPGATRPPTHTANPQGDRDRQRLRELERRVRRAKLREAAAIDPAARRAAAAKVRAAQAAIRAHVDATGLIRQRPREQIGVAR
ncbi:phage minor capsid protein [Salinispora arenicola]|uniref:phage minor capsid protein n=1 Tax=Salinispora arenicola TaxID=168697 RepID=UPI00039A0894|nr:phage minor capsid protein [Salinispora arenicola]